ncbi:MAG: UvrB/UvrC motif-containing protein [Candidatus Latescibacterota bacterium]
MKCESCRKREATVAYTQVVDSGKKTVHLCSACLGQQNVHVSTKAPPAAGQAPPAQPKGAPAPAATPSLQCPACGLTYEEFRKAGRFGCHACYDAFGEPLERLMKRIHGAAVHVGKARVQPRSADHGEGDLKRLRHELELAVAAEAYEQAADLRDRIRDLESEAHGEAR